MSALPLSLLCEQQEEAKREVCYQVNSQECQELASLSGYLDCSTLGPTPPPSITADTRPHVLEV